MKAWRFYGFSDMRLDDVRRARSAGRTTWLSSRCAFSPASPRPSWRRAFPRWPTTGSSAGSRPRRRCSFSATSSAPASSKSDAMQTRFRPGDRVAARAKLPCGRCALCRIERSDLCRQGPVIGFDLPGCFAELAVAARNRAGQSRRPHLRQRSGLSAIAQRQRGGRRDGPTADRRQRRDLRPGEHGPGVPAGRPAQRRRA